MIFALRAVLFPTVLRGRFYMSTSRRGITKAARSQVRLHLSQTKDFCHFWKDSAFPGPGHGLRTSILPAERFSPFKNRDGGRAVVSAANRFAACCFPFAGGSGLLHRAAFGSPNRNPPAPGPTADRAAAISSTRHIDIGRRIGRICLLPVRILLLEFPLGAAEDVQIDIPFVAVIAFQPRAVGILPERPCMHLRTSGKRCESRCPARHKPPRLRYSAHTTPQ